MRQEPGQPVQSFLANLRSKARQFDMKLTCSKTGCGQENNYREPALLSLFISVVSDAELKQDLVAE